MSDDEALRERGEQLASALRELTRLAEWRSGTDPLAGWNDRARAALADWERAANVPEETDATHVLD